MIGNFMKRIPFKCSFGHITIVKFGSGEETLSVIECEQCKKLDDAIIFSFGYQHNSSKYLWYGKNRKVNNTDSQVLAHRY